MSKTDGETIKVEVQTLEDLKKGKLLFGSFGESFEKAGMQYGELCSIGVLEGGTEEGNPSICLLIKVKYNVNGKEDYFYTIAECTGRNFMTASGIANMRIVKFLASMKHEKML